MHFLLKAVRVAVLVLVALPRLTVLTAVELLSAAVCTLAAFGTDREQPLANEAPWRRRLVETVVPPCTRVALMCVGFWVSLPPPQRD